MQRLAAQDAQLVGEHVIMKKVDAADEPFGGQDGVGAILELEAQLSGGYLDARTEEKAEIDKVKTRGGLVVENRNVQLELLRNGEDGATRVDLEVAEVWREALVEVEAEME